MEEREVVVTGMGLLTPLGRNLEENGAHVIQMKTGITRHPGEGLPDRRQYFGKIDQVELPVEIPAKHQAQIRFLNRGALLGFAASCEALARAAPNLEAIPPGRRALYIASGDFTKVGYDFLYPAMKEATSGQWRAVDYEKLNQATLNQVNPFFLLESIANNLFSFLAAFTEFRGPNTSLASLSPYGGQALELAYRSIKEGRADLALAVGYGNWITEIPLYELDGLGLLSRCRHGARSFRPFDRARDGFIPGEGGAAFVLEPLGHAVSRGATIHGKILGAGSCIELTDGPGLRVPPRVVKRSIQSALQEARSAIRDLAFISPHGSGTMKGDRSELQSIVEVFDDQKTRSPLCGLKPYTGHMGAASDLAEIILGLHALRQGLVPATLHFQESDKEFSMLEITKQHTPTNRQVFLSLSYGIGGQSSATVVSMT